MIELNWKKRVFQILVYAWLLTIPLRNSIFGISFLGYDFAINLLFSGILFICLLPQFFSFNLLEKAVIGLTGGWLLFAVFSLRNVGIDFFSLFDIHSLLNQFLYSFILLGLIHNLGIVVFKGFIIFFLRYYLLFLLTFGFFEFFTLYHIEGSNVMFLEDLPVSSIFYAPFFIYDNNNDYCLLLILTFVLLFSFDNAFRNNYLQVIIAFLCIFLFSYLAQARMGLIVCFILFLYFVFMYLRKSVQLFLSQKNNCIMVCSIILFTVLIFVFNSSSNVSKVITAKQDYPPVLVLLPDGTTEFYKKAPEVKALLKSEMGLKDDPLESVNIRLNLILNGIDLAKEHPVFGAGPGSYSRYHFEGKAARDTTEITNAHNLVIELVSQYGIITWIYFSFFAVLIFRFFKSEILSKDKYWIITVILLYPFIGIIPSSFLYLNIHWMFLPLIVILFEYRTHFLNIKDETSTIL